MPVSMELLNQLVVASDKVLVGYNAIPTKAMLVGAWSFSMRVCEMTTTGEKDAGHNLKGNAIKISDLGLSTAFESDKMAKFNDCIKRHMIVWSRLPPYTNKVIEDYKSVRPVESDYFFCHKEGRPLTRDDFRNLLDLCLIHMDWAFLNMTPHGLRQGRATHETLQGIEMATILHSGHWTDKSKAFNAYARTDFIALLPSQIMTDYPQCKKKWTTPHLQFLLKNTLESTGSPDSHPHWQCLKEIAPEKISIYLWIYLQPSLTCKLLPACNVKNRTATPGCIFNNRSTKEPARKHVSKGTVPWQRHCVRQHS